MLTRRGTLCVLVSLGVVAAACSGSDDTKGSEATGGAAGAQVATGGAGASDGIGGAMTGGVSSQGGSAGIPVPANGGIAGTTRGRAGAAGTPTVFGGAAGTPSAVGGEAGTPSVVGGEAGTPSVVGGSAGTPSVVGGGAGAGGEGGSFICTPGTTQPCEVANDYGTCTSIALCEPAVGYVCDAPTPLPESCNGLDDNCSGEADEGYAWQGILVGEECDALGECGLGRVECTESEDEARCSTGPGGSEDQSQTESCNGLDDNCDGDVDESFTWKGLVLGEPCDPPGPCAPGTVVCSADGSGAVCSTGPDGPDDQSQPDVCANGIDEDCNGIADDLTADPVAVGCSTQGVCANPDLTVVLCEDPSGAPVCDYSYNPLWEASETLCDHLDNDCDGAMDEGLTNDDSIPIGGGCDGKGECGSGTVECHPTNGRTICSTEEGGTDDQSQPEQCNALDDDCDGEIDEDFTWEGLGIGQPCDPPGVCAPGVVECPTDGMDGVCSTGPGGSSDMSSPEICGNDIDEDCDGLADPC